MGTITSSMLSGVKVPSAYDPVTKQPIPDSEIPWRTATRLEGLGYTLSTQLAPTLAGEMAFYGIQRLGEQVGLDPRISQLAGITLNTGIGNIANPGNDAKNILDGIQDGLTRGALQLGLSYATEDLDPLLGGLASSAVTGAIDGLITVQNPLDPNSQRKGIFAGIGDTLTRAVGGFTQIGKVVPGDPVTTAQNLAQLNDFSNIIREQGLGAAVETYATSLLYRSSVESLISAKNNFSIQQAINSQLQDPGNLVELDGQQVIQIDLGLGPNGQKGYLWVDPTSHDLVASLQGQDYFRYTAPPKVHEDTGTAAVTDALIERSVVDPLTGDEILTRIRLEAAGADWIEIEGANGAAYRITPDNLNRLRLNDDGTIRDGILTDTRTGLSYRFHDGQPEPQAELDTSVLLDLPEIQELGINELTYGDLAAAIEGLHLTTPDISETPPVTTDQAVDGWGQFVEGLRSSATQILGLNRANVFLQQMSAIGQQILRQPTATAAETEAALAQEEQIELSTEEQQSLGALIRDKVMHLRVASQETASYGIQQFIALASEADHPLEMLNPAKMQQMAALSILTVGALATEDMTRLGEGTQQAKQAWAEGRPFRATWYFLQDVGRGAMLFSGAKALLGGLAGGLKIARTTQLAEEVTAATRVTSSGVGAGVRIKNLFEGLWNRVAGKFGWAQHLTTDAGKMERLSNGVVRFLDANGTVREGLMLSGRTGAEIATEAVSFLKQGRLTASEVASLGRMNVVSQTDLVQPAFQALKETLNTGGNTAGLVQVLRQSPAAVRGTTALIDGEIAFVRHYTTAEGIEAIRQSGKILSPTGDKVFFSVQHFGQGPEANDLLAIGKNLTHYIDVPVARIAGQVDDVSRVAPVAELGLRGNGVQVVTRSGSQIDLSGLDLNKLIGTLATN